MKLHRFWPKMNTAWPGKMPNINLKVATYTYAPAPKAVELSMLLWKRGSHYQDQLKVSRFDLSMC
jgi:hypothetical protein